MPTQGTIVSLQVGRPQTMTTPKGTAWTSAIVKAPVSGPVLLGAENFDGDDQANRKYHGGPDKAVCAYFAAHYPGWHETLGLELPFGAFGENLTIGDLTEADVCIGDIFTVGEAMVQVTQPRQPCANITKRWNSPKLPTLMRENGQTGFYACTIQKGFVAAGDPLVLIDRFCDGWNLLRANTLMYHDAADPLEIAALRDLPLLSAEWKRILGKRITTITGS